MANQSAGTSVLASLKAAVTLPARVLSFDEIVRGITGRSGTMRDRIGRAVDRMGKN